MQSTKDINQKCISLILGGGEGSRLYPLTKERSKDRVIGTFLGAAIATCIVLITQNVIVYGVLAVISLTYSL
jgi:ADP-glucose pyrophosphorylase